ncbi:MAG: TIGR02584 family CRISPR-associated protein [Moraxellaceae bacterium]|nr:TIGR02584 family CRISPR-associated protein [Moraxellaceae bacterium]MCP5177332.1 TIGR02584 family CRISPR-associated protein [Moraxellaceae bacterium]
MKNILFLVTGMTPQIITETLWALACDPENEDKWIPDEIHVMSTEQGLNQIRERLLNKGNLQKLINDYQLKPIMFDDNYLHSIQKNGQALPDLKTPEDNQLAGDAICAKIREFTQQDDISLHVSIAGGRKTMGFYAGYALSLYGRSQDRMSHVLVEDTFETIPDFYYPTPNSSFVTDRNNKVWNAKDAKVWLANIEFVRMKDAIKEKHQLKGDDSFSEVISKINDSFNDVTLTLNLHNRSIVVNDKYRIDDLSPREFAFLHWFADLRRNGKTGIIAPKCNSNSKGVRAEDAQYLTELTELFLPYYEDLKNSEDKEFMLDKKFFDSVKSLLKTSLDKALGLELAEKIIMKQSNKTNKKGSAFYIDLPPTAIQIIDKFNN